METFESINTMTVKLDQFDAIELNDSMIGKMLYIERAFGPNIDMPFMLGRIESVSESKFGVIVQYKQPVEDALFQRIEFDEATTVWLENGVETS